MRRQELSGGIHVSGNGGRANVSVVSSDKTQETLYGTGSDREKEREISLPDDSTGPRVVHRFDKTSFREDIGKRECSCVQCECGDTTACIGKRCECCTVS